MQKISNILFFTIIICAQISINTKNMRSIIQEKKVNELNFIARNSTNATNAQKTDKNLPSNKDNVNKQNQEKPKKELEKPDSKGKVAAPITQRKFSKNNNTISNKVNNIVPRAHTNSTIPIPRKNKKLGQRNKQNTLTSDQKNINKKKQNAKAKKVVNSIEEVVAPTNKKHSSKNVDDIVDLATNQIDDITEKIKGNSKSTISDTKEELKKILSRINA